MSEYKMVEYEDCDCDSSDCECVMYCPVCHRDMGDEEYCYCVGGFYCMECGRDLKDDEDCYCMGSDSGSEREDDDEDDEEEKEEKKKKEKVTKTPKEPMLKTLNETKAVKKTKQSKESKKEKAPKKKVSPAEEKKEKLKKKVKKDKEEDGLDPVFTDCTKLCDVVEYIFPDQDMRDFVVRKGEKVLKRSEELSLIRKRLERLGDDVEDVTLSFELGLGKDLTETCEKMTRQIIERISYLTFEITPLSSDWSLVTFGLKRID